MFYLFKCRNRLQDQNHRAGWKESQTSDLVSVFLRRVFFPLKRKSVHLQLKLVCCFQGHCRAGEVPHHHYSLLQRSDGKSGASSYTSSPWGYLTFITGSEMLFVRKFVFLHRALCWSTTSATRSPSKT